MSSVCGQKTIEFPLISAIIEALLWGLEPPQWTYVAPDHLITQAQVTNMIQGMWEKVPTVSVYKCGRKSPLCLYINVEESPHCICI